MALNSTLAIPEKPLEPHRRFLLALGALGIVFLAYGFVLFGILGLLILLPIELAFVILGARFGLAGYFLRRMASHSELLMVFFRSVRVSRETRKPFILTEQEAPDLFSTTRELCARAGVPFPNQIVLGMGLNAAVELRGIWKGRGETTLLLGIDLLAGLTVSEVESVLGHELMHALRVQRGAAFWLRGGLQRIQQLAIHLQALIGESKAQNQKAWLATLVHGWSDFLARSCTQLVAACSRQDEFDADRGAAELCGDAVFRQSLVRLHALDAVVSRISWAERVARCRSSTGVVDWLVTELANPCLEPDADQGEVTSNRYSTHPSLADRLNALPTIPTRRTLDSRPGVHLLADAEPLAVRLTEESRRIAGEWEFRDDRQLLRSARRFFGGGKLRPPQVLGVALILFGLLWTFLVVVDARERGMTLVFGGIAVVLMALGVVLYRLGIYRSKFRLPIPEYSLIRESGKRPPPGPEFERQVEAEVKTLAPDTLGNSRRATLLAASSHAALAQCDFPRAFLFARACIQLEPKSIPGGVAWMMACASTGNGRLVPQALQFLRRQTGLRGAEMAWAVAWSSFQTNDWVHAEITLTRCLHYHPAHPTLLALLGIVQSQRGKWQTALENVRRAVGQRPDDRELIRLLVHVCIHSGEVREASEWLSSKLDGNPPEPQTLTQWLVIHLLTGDIDRAEAVRARLEEAHPIPQQRMEVALKFEAYRQDARAEALFLQVLDSGFHPAAFLGLARIAARRRDWESARIHLQRAMDLESPVGDGSPPAAALIGQSLNQLRALGRTVLGCRVWWVTVQTSPHPFLPSGTRFLVAAQSLGSAKTHLREALAAMLPKQPPTLAGALAWEEAPSSMQPDGPFAPGVVTITD